MDVSLSADPEKLVNAQVESCRYTSASEVISQALRLLQEQEQLRDAKGEALRREIAKGAEQADRGELIPGEEVFDKLKNKNDAINRAR